MFTGSPAPPAAHAQVQQQQQAHETVSESTEIEVEENGDNGDERLPDDARRASASAAIPPGLDSDSSLSATAPGDPLPLPSFSSDLSLHVIHPSLQGGGPGVLGLAHPLFTIKQLGVDRRLLVNRKRQLKMYRVWMQGKFQRTEADSTPLVAELNACTS